jgi:tetratricopeptide (TPR) repeat protein
MSKLRWALLILPVVAIAAAAIFLFRRFPREVSPESPPRAKSIAGPESPPPAKSIAGVESPPKSKSIAEIEQEDAPPLPDVSLEINKQREAQVIQGTPLILTVRAANPRAANTLATNQAHERSLALIQEKLSKGELSSQDAQPMLELARVKREVRTVRLGASDRGWEKYLHFEAQTAGSPFAPVNWPLALVKFPDVKSVLLDGTTNAQVQYALDPQAAAQVPAGEYVLQAVLEVEAGTSLPQELWRGRVASGSVKLRIRPAPAQLSAADQASMKMQRAEFFSTTSDWANALQSAQDALKEDPRLIRAQMIQGEAKEARGDLAGARDALSQALRLFYEQYPDSYERPQYLLDRIAALDKRLGSQPGRAAATPSP